MVIIWRDRYLANWYGLAVRCVQYGLYEWFATDNAKIHFQCILFASNQNSDIFMMSNVSTVQYGIVLKCYTWYYWLIFAPKWSHLWWIKLKIIKISNCNGLDFSFPCHFVPRRYKSRKFLLFSHWHPSNKFQCLFALYFNRNIFYLFNTAHSIMNKYCRDNLLNIK